MIKKTTKLLDDELISLLLEGKTQAQKEKTLEKITLLVKENEKQIVKEVFELWNKGAEKLGWAKITTKGKTYLARAKKVRDASSEISEIEDWRNILNQAIGKAFITPSGGVWKPNFDWLFRNNNYMKLHEEFIAEQNSSNSDFQKNVKKFMGA